VLLTAADTYVVVVALPSIMAGVGVGLDRLQRATPIVSGFLLGYTVVLPLIGRLADLLGTDKVFQALLAVFAGGSVLTATAHSLPVVVAGRALQGVGGGGLVPVTLAMVAGTWPPERRGTPLGVVGALQEFGNLIGPLYGAAIVTIASWRAIFWLNVPLVVLLWIGFRLVGAPSATSTSFPRAVRYRLARAGPAATAACGSLVLVVALDAPRSIATSTTAGAWFAPYWAGPWAAFSTPAAVLGAGLLIAGGLAAIVLRITAHRKLASAHRAAAPPDSAVPPEPTGRQERRGILASAVVRDADLPGAVLLAGALGCVVVLFSTEDPSREVVASSAPLLAGLGVLMLVAFWVRERSARSPLIPAAAVAARQVRGALAVNLFVGAALMSALVDVPLFARATVDPGSQLGAALVLLRFLVMVPLGAFVGGALCRRISLSGVVAGTGMALACVAFLSMTRWSATSLGGGPRPSDLALGAAGFGFGLAIAPVNVAILGSVEAGLHGLAASLGVVARTVGMLAGVSALTAVALHRFYQAQAKIASPFVLCPDHPTSCAAYDKATTKALLSELHTVFAGAALCAAVAAVLAFALLRSESPPRTSAPAG
jgi:MFS family permease